MVHICRVEIGERAFWHVEKKKARCLTNGVQPGETSAILPRQLFPEHLPISNRNSETSSREEEGMEEHCLQGGSHGLDAE